MFVAGLVSAAAGGWFVLADHPFTGPAHYSDEFGMTLAEVDAFNPAISRAVVADSTRAGAVSLGWGMFVMVLAWLGVRRRHRWTVAALWAGGLPALTIAAFAEPLQFRRVEVGSVMAMAVLAVFVVGLVLAGRAVRLDPHAGATTGPSDRSTQLVS